MTISCRNKKVSHLPIGPIGYKIHFPLVGRGKYRHNFVRYPNNHAQLPPGGSLRFGTWLFVLAVLLAPKSRASQVEIPIELAPQRCVFNLFLDSYPQSQAKPRFEDRDVPKFNQEKKTIPYLLLFYRQSSIPNMTLLPKSNFLGSQKLPPPENAKKSPLTLSCGNTKMAREISSILG